MNKIITFVFNKIGLILDISVFCGVIYLHYLGETIVSIWCMVFIMFYGFLEYKIDWKNKPKD